MPAPTPCYTLFSNATSDGTSSGTLPTETVTAALNIAHNPGKNVANLFGLVPAAAPFQPSLPTDTDLTIALSFTGGGVISPTGIAVDGFGNVWTVNEANGGAGNSASKFAAGTGAALSPAGTGYTGGGINLPYSIAIDSLNNVWIGDSSSGGLVADAHLTKLAEDGTPISATGYNLGFVGSVTSIGIDNYGNAIVAPRVTASKVDGVTGAVTQLATNNNRISWGLAIAPSGAIWLGVSNSFPGIDQLDITGAIVFPSGTNPYNGGYTGLQNPIGVAIDHGGNVWVANGGTVNGNPEYGIAKFSSSGALIFPATSGYIPTAMGIDGLGHVFIAQQNNLMELDNDGSAIEGNIGRTGSFSGYYDSSLNDPIGLAVDSSGNVWMANYFGDSITEFVGLGSPVVTPIAAGVANNTLGTRP